MAEAGEFHKNLSQPDETRRFLSHGHMDFVQLGRDVSIGRAEFEPGWKWIDDVKPLAGTDTCQAAHAGFCVSGSMLIHMDDGTEFSITAGDAYQIPPGHVASVDGPEKCVMIDVQGYRDYAKPVTKVA